jgi:hypothetical protein
MFDATRFVFPGDDEIDIVAQPADNRRRPNEILLTLDGRQVSNHAYPQASIRAGTFIPPLKTTNIDSVCNTNNLFRIEDSLGAQSSRHGFRDGNDSRRSPQRQPMNSFEREQNVTSKHQRAGPSRDQRRQRIIARHVSMNNLNLVMTNKSRELQSSRNIQGIPHRQLHYILFGNCPELGRQGRRRRDRGEHFVAPLRQTICQISQVLLSATELARWKL